MDGYLDSGQHNVQKCDWDQDLSINIVVYRPKRDAKAVY